MQPAANKVRNKKIIFLSVLAVFLIEILLFFPIVGAGLFLNQAIKSIEASDLSKAKNQLSFANRLIWLSKKLNQLSGTVFFPFKRHLAIDSVNIIEENSHFLLRDSIEIFDNVKKIAPLVINKQRTQNEDNQLKILLTKFKLKTKDFAPKLSIISQEINRLGKGMNVIKTRINKLDSLVKSTGPFIDNIDDWLGKNGEKKYLIFFLNNMEIRPGGGFIGSFGILTLNNYSLKNLQIEDVYEADGQLKIHVDPPWPIRKYLGLPHWFLRDSNFSPDFADNVKIAEFFLENELGVANFDGAIGITTTAIGDILEIFGEIYLPDFGETVTKDNFYIKTQAQVEQKFFAGSIQKKSFLSSLARALILRLETASYKDLLPVLKRSFNGKQLVIYFKDDKLQKHTNQLGWGGALIIPQCSTSEKQCLVDSFFPVDANVGINKTNFFIHRLISQSTNFNTDGSIENQLSITFNNNSQHDTFPGGIYKNYFQIYLPSKSTIKEIANGDLVVKDFEEKEEKGLKLIGFYFETLPKKTTKIVVNYSLREKINPGRNTYQLTVQKQIGSSNNDFIWEIYLPVNISIVSHDFEAQAKDGRLIYRAPLSEDKTFTIELIKN